MELEKQSRCIRAGRFGAPLKLIFTGVTILAAAACGKPADGPTPMDTGGPIAVVQDGYPEAIRQVLARDTDLGRLRNHAPETDTLANTVRAYVAALAEIDFSSCPPEFTDAFGRHREAWRASIDFLQDFDQLRGEIHVLFDEIRGRDESTRGALELIERDIWETWAEVEAVAERYGVAGAEEPEEAE